ncbi:hypothetical protein K466DRAFT_52274 [Polyporus arcularius HHB13444]|uniref:Uncharacterized protein n=1 Tax=Polyporus arcularius HHB13444 TaxID=1314778 RepID=A0A5C3PL03_9APHY|nr:hypothetical protein K466DRAFT_52274 [Polyporus arcularius HHB13444]
MLFTPCALYQVCYIILRHVLPPWLVRSVQMRLTRRGNITLSCRVPVLDVVHPFCERGRTCQLVDNLFMLRQPGRTLSSTSGQQYGSGQKFAATFNVEHCTGAGTSIKSGSRSTSSWRQTPAAGCPRRPSARPLLRGVEREPCLQAASTNTRISCFSGTEKSARFRAA